MDNVLEVKNLSASWDGQPVLRNISLALHSGELVCLTGPNGSGKSTLLTLLAGIKETGLEIETADELPSFNGKLLIGGLKQKHCTRKEIARHISYLTQNETSSWNYKVRDIVLTGRYSHTGVSGSYSAHDYEVVDSILEELHISSFADKSIFSLSGGEFQKVRIARSLAQEPDMLLLDEPVANLDFGYQAELLFFIQNLAHKQNKGILVSIHDLNTAARFADTLLILSKFKKMNQKQKMVIGKPEEILVPEILKSIYGIQFGTFIHPEYKCIQVYTKN